MGQFSKKFVTKVLKYGVGIRDPEKTYSRSRILNSGPGVKKAPDLESGSATLVWKNLFCYYYFSPLNTFMRKGKDPRGPKKYGSRCGYGTEFLLICSENLVMIRHSVALMLKKSKKLME